MYRAQHNIVSDYFLFSNTVMRYLQKEMNVYKWNWLCIKTHIPNWSTSFTLWCKAYKLFIHFVETQWIEKNKIISYHAQMLKNGNFAYCSLSKSKRNFKTNIKIFKFLKKFYCVHYHVVDLMIYVTSIRHKERIITEEEWFLKPEFMFKNKLLHSGFSSTG